MEGKLLLSHVEFKFLRNSYPLHEKLFCYFQSPSVSQWQPEIGDWVGLYKVGWSTLKEHKIRKPIQQEWLENSKNLNVDYVHVVFEQHELPRDIDGLYQFVYVTKMNVVKGISTPFRFETTLLQQQQQPEVELRKIYTKVYPSQEQQQQQQQQEIRLTGKETVVEGEIKKDTIKEYANMFGIYETSVNSKLLRKYLNSIRSIQNDDVTKKVEELFVENGKLCNSLKSRIQEVSELKRECDDIKTVNVDLLTRLANAERKVEQLEREKDLNVRRIEDITRDFSRVGLDRQVKQQITKENESLLERLLSKNQPMELKSVYDELETPTVVDAKIKLVQRGIVEEPMVLPTQRERLMEKLRERELVTPSHANRFLKRVIEDLNENELLRQTESTIVETTPFGIKQQHPELRELQQPRVKLFVDEQPRPRSMTIESLPSISVSTIVPEQQKIKSITITKVEQPKEWQKLQQKEIQRIQQQQQQQQQRLQKILEPVQIQSSSSSSSVVNESKPCWQTVEPKCQWQTVEPKCQWQTVEPKYQWQTLEQRPWQSMESKQWQSLESLPRQHQLQQQQQNVERQLAKKHWIQQQREQQQQPEWLSEKQQMLRGQVGDYLNRLDEQIRSKIEERLRNKLQEQLEGKKQYSSLYKVDQQRDQQRDQQQQQQRINEYVQRLQQSEEQQREQNQPRVMYVPKENYFQKVEYLIQKQQEQREREQREQQEQQEQQEQKQRQLCPVCGVVMPLELNVCDFEIHVNSHFSD